MERDSLILTKALTETAPRNLDERILCAVARVRTRRAHTLLFFSSAVCAVSATGGVWAISRLITASYESGFSSFASLLVSDSALVTGHLTTYGLTLLESLPGPETLLVLFALAMFLVSLRGIMTALTRQRVRTALT